MIMEWINSGGDVEGCAELRSLSTQLSEITQDAVTLLPASIFRLNECMVKHVEDSFLGNGGLVLL